MKNVVRVCIDPNPCCRAQAITQFYARTTPSPPLPSPRVYTVQTMGERAGHAAIRACPSRQAMLDRGKELPAPRPQMHIYMQARQSCQVQRGDVGRTLHVGILR